jgi:hypothetical protein
MTLAISCIEKYPKSGFIGVYPIFTAVFLHPCDREVLKVPFDLYTTPWACRERSNGTPLSTWNMDGRKRR